MKKIRWFMMGIILLFVMHGAVAQDTSSPGEEPIMLTSSDINRVGQDNRDRILLSNLLSAMEKRFDVTFLYKEEVMVNKYVPKDHIRIDEKTGQELSQVLKQLGIAYQRIDKQTYVLLDKVLPMQTIQVQEDIHGTVTDAQSGETLPGVNVMIKGTTTGTSTDSDGQYELDAPSLQDTLVFSFVGYQMQEVPINGRSEIDVSMQSQAIAGEELVVVGYGTQRREEVTSSISHISEEDFAQGTAYQSPLQLLSGRVAGLAVSRASGGDPTSGIEMQLRGVSSVRGDNSPLVVIDGVPGGSLNAIPPESIESIDVLRDGSAAAIYGTRANAGVIIITTKSGKSGSPEISYSTQLYTESYANKPDVLTADQYRQFKNEWANSDDPFWRSLAAPMIDYGHSTDWFEVISRRTLSQIHNISVSGGSESTRYQGSLNYRDQNGLIKGTGQEEVNGRLSLIHTGLDDRLTVNLRLNNTFLKSHPFDGEIMAEPFYRNPTQPVYNVDSSLEEYLYNPDGKYFEISGYNNANPVGLIEQINRENRSSVFLGSGKVSYELIRGLEASIMGAYERTDGTNNYYESRDSWQSWNNTQANGVASKSSLLAENRTMETTLNYETEFVGKHSISAVAGYTYQEVISESFSAANRTFLSDVFGTHNLSAGLQISRGAFSDPVSSSKNSNKLIAGFGRLNYSYDNKYLLSVSFRREGSTKFGANNKWGNFPAISAGWRIGSESFMENINFVNDFKIRIGFGVTGNQGIPNYLSLSRLSSAGYMLYQGNWIPGYTPSSNLNPNLRWEKKAETNIGIEATIFDNVSFTIDLYDRTTTDLLYEYRVPVPPNIYERTWANVGSINNQGIEFSVNINPVTTSTFLWNSNFNISYNKNELESLSNDEYERSFLMLGMPNAGRLGLTGETIYRVEEGEPIGNIYTWEHAGFTEDGKWQVWDESNSSKIHPSEATFEDRRITGNGLPKSWLGFNNTFAYKNVDLRFSLRGALGFDLLNAIDLHRANPNTIPANMPVRGLEDPELSQVRDQRNYVDSYWIERGDYVKIDNITLGYTFSVGTVKQLRIYASGQNLYTLTQYKGEDPEQSIQGLIPGYDDYWDYPRTKTFTLGLDITF